MPIAQSQSLSRVSIKNKIFAACLALIGQKAGGEGYPDLEKRVRELYERDPDVQSGAKKIPDDPVNLNNLEYQMKLGEKHRYVIIDGVTEAEVLGGAPAAEIVKGDKDDPRYLDFFTFKAFGGVGVEMREGVPHWRGKALPADKWHLCDAFAELKNRPSNNGQRGRKPNFDAMTIEGLDLEALGLV